LVRSGRKVGVVDLTRGELGTRGTPEIRDQEARDASAILGLSCRENLGMKDGFFENDIEHQLQIVRMIRKYQPAIILCNAVSDRHPDHGRAAALVARGAFLAGLLKVETVDGGRSQEPWKCRALYHYIQDRYMTPDFVVDVETVWKERMDAVLAFRSQFYNPDSDEPETPISSREFLEYLEAKALVFARPAGLKYAEGYLAARTPAVQDIFHLL
jgi:bacillithiol biosynthesis deacetylase BshB1